LTGNVASIGCAHKRPHARSLSLKAFLPQSQTTAAAEARGLAVAIGQDAVQAVMARAFAVVRHDKPPTKPKGQTTAQFGSIAKLCKLLRDDISLKHALNQINKQSGSAASTLNAAECLPEGEGHGGASQDLRDIKIGSRHQRDRGEIAALAGSFEDLGLLHRRKIVRANDMYTAVPAANVDADMDEEKSVLRGG